MTGATACLSAPATDRLDHLLGRIGSELERLAERLSHVGVADHRKSRRAAPLAASQIVALQSVDQAEQTLRELAVTLRRAADCEGGSVRIDLAKLAEGLRLAHTTAVILGAEESLADGGDLDLF